MRKRTTQRGGTLTELMVATVILSIGVLGLFSAFRFIARTTLISRATSLATNLGQERIESLKNLSYYALQITTASATNATVSPSFLYDTGNYPPETIAIGGITFTRYTYVGMAEMTGSDITDVAYTYPDTGLKQITTHVVWSEGGVKKVWSLRNLLENPNINPLDATIGGTVSNSAGGTVAGALVFVEQNEDWNATANAAGVYSFSVYHGTYTVRASSAGFTDAVSTSMVVARGATKNVPLTLTAAATGSITSNLWLNSNVVISQVVAVTNTMVGDGTFHDIEYVELYNPTTFPIDIGTTGQAQKNIMLAYYDESWCNTFCSDGYRYDSSWYAEPHGLFETNVTTYVGPGRYYLIANASYFYISGGWVRADAYMDNDLVMPLTYPNFILDDKAGTVALYFDWLHGGSWIDAVGWADNNNNAPWGEGSTIADAGGVNDGLGVPAGKQLVRVSSPGISAANLPNFGRAYDSNNNRQDFLYEGTYFTGFVYPPKSSASGVFTTLTGKVPTSLGTVFVSASDPNSGSTLAYTSYITSGALSLPYSKFVLGGVSTGTWTVSAAYSSYAAFIDSVVVSQGLYTSFPNAVSSPSWVASGLYHTQMSSTTYLGFVKGTVTNTFGLPISGITVIGGGSSKVTGSNGVYFMSTTTGTVTVVANPNNSNTSYVQSIEDVNVAANGLTTQNFVLSLGGRITGYVTTGTTPLAYQAIALVNGAGSQAGSGVTDTGGNFTIRNVSTGTYTVFPVLESGQDVSPNTLPAVLTTTGSVAVGTFTVNGAFGNIAGTVSDASGLITSGALILASTSAIASTPSAIVGSSAPAQTPLYMVSSKADGTYILPVRGSATYYLSAYVPVISGTGVTVTTKTYSNIIVAPSASTTKNVTIP